MSISEQEIENIKATLLELTKKIEKNKPRSHFDSSSELGDLNESLNYENNKNRMLIEQNSQLRQEVLRLNGKLNEYKDFKNKQIEQEKKLSKIFSLYAQDKKLIQEQYKLILKLKNQCVELQDRLNIEVRRYENLKNQLSYKLGSRLVGIKKVKDLKELPTQLFKDYVSVRVKVKTNKALTNNTNQISSSMSNSNLTAENKSVIFNDGIALPLSVNLTKVLFSENSKGPVYIDLLSYKSSSTVSVEIQIRAVETGCAFKLAPDFSNTHYLSKNEVLTVSMDLSNDQPLKILDILSSGTLEFAIKKNRGDQSFVYLYKNTNSSAFPREALLDSEQSSSSERLIRGGSIAIPVPKLKKKNGVFIEAWQINQSDGYESANAFLKKYASSDNLKVNYIFQANNNLSNEKKWLDYLNKYINTFGIENIKLNSGNQELFYRINCEPGYHIDESIKVSIIMPVYNAEKTVNMAIMSILNQTWRNIELIIVNDCSTDASMEIIQRLARKDIRIKVINNPCNVGAYVSKNLGLRVATGKYITGHDSDDWAHPQRIEKHINLVFSEEVPPRASITRMIRMEENGLIPIYRTSNFCRDGVLRIASITCLFETNFLRHVLGGWDCSRFGADSEIIERSKIVLGSEFKDFNTLSMICLDAETSLTNDPEHGISKINGISPSRKYYKEQWSKWHKSLNKDNVYLDFPHLNRNFEVPEGTEVPVENILAAINNIESHYE